MIPGLEQIERLAARKDFEARQEAAARAWFMGLRAAMGEVEAEVIEIREEWQPFLESISNLPLEVYARLGGGPSAMGLREAVREVRNLLGTGASAPVIDGYLVSEELAAGRAFYALDLCLNFIALPRVLRRRLRAIAATWAELAPRLEAAGEAPQLRAASAAWATLSPTLAASRTAFDPARVGR